jgi:RNA polymerase sigma-70 factor (ECF subfamily)
MLTSRRALRSADRPPELFRLALARPADSKQARVAQVVRRHAGLVWRILRRSGLRPADAEDAIQDVFWILLQRLDAVAPAAEQAFLVTTALRVAADRRRSKWNRAVTEALDPEVAAPDALSPEEAAELRRGRTLIDEALGALDREEREVFVLLELEQMTREQVAVVLGLAPGTVASRMRRAALAAAAALVFWVRREPRRQGFDVVAEPQPLRTNAPVSACAHPLHAAGGEPAIDDFEDGDGALLPLEGRHGWWIEVRDVDAPGHYRPLLPALRPQELERSSGSEDRGRSGGTSPPTVLAPADQNRFALHVVGGELRDWGAAHQFSLVPPCYDASIYAGIAFSARGPGRVYLTVSEVRVVPTEYGGTCTRDCYNGHVRKIDLARTWQRHEVRWSELHQRGYETPPLDPRSLHTVSFVVRAEDTPYDLWIDDVAFLPRAP